MAGARTIVIVGNGEVPEGAAGIIDAADIVIRFNDCRSVGAGGTKTDIVAVCNTGRPALAMLGGGRWKTSQPVRDASEIWCVRDAEKFAAMRDDIVSRHPDLEDFCDDYTEGFASFAAATGRTFRIISANVHETLDDELKSLGAQNYIVPSSGLIVAAEVLESLAEPDDVIMLAGFSHQGWKWHPFEAEREWVDDLILAGWLKRLPMEVKMPHVSPFMETEM